MPPSDEPLFDGHLSSLWEGPLAPLTQPETFPLILGALARALWRRPAVDDEERPLVRALLSVNGPSADRVWVTCQRDGAPVTLVEALARLRERGHDVERDGISGWCGALEPDFSGSFVLDPDEFFERGLAAYHGFLHAWTDEHTARAYYRTWPRRRQAEFEHEYLLYAANDATHAPDPEVQAAAHWLRSKRRYVLKWTVGFNERPTERPAWVSHFEATLVEHLEALCEGLRGDDANRWALANATELLTGLFVAQAPSTFEQVLTALNCDEGYLRPLRSWGRAYQLFSLSLSGDAAAAPALARVHRLLRAATRWLW